MSDLPSRPHPAPCACEECASWARVVVATPALRKPPSPAREALTAAPPAEPTAAAFMRGITALACKATGLTEEQLRARARDIGDEFMWPAPERASRETVAARGVPEIHLAAVYDTEPKTCDALKAVQEAIAGRCYMLVLSGGVGVRKTGSACWALTQKPGRYVKAARLAALSTSHADDERAAYSLLFRCQVLVIDDLGGEYLDEKGYFVKLLNEMLDERYERKLTTIVTTNITRAQFENAYGVRVLDRLSQSGRWLNIGGASVRREMRQHWSDGKESA